jgi:hypothetical protein
MFRLKPLFFQRFAEIPRNSQTLPQKAKKYGCNTFSAVPEKLSRENGEPLKKLIIIYFS